MELEELIDKIAAASGTEKDDIQERIDTKKDELGGLITKEGAAHIVANELGISLFNRTSSQNEIKINNMAPNMSNVDVTGRVLRAFPIREFTKKDGSKGKVLNLILGDDTGTIRVVFWGDNTRLLEDGKLNEGDILRIKEGYTKEDLNSRSELHIGSRTRIIVNPKDINEDEYPERSPSVQKKISELTEDSSQIEILCKVLRIYEIREFSRKDGTPGKVANAFVADDTGSARLVFWDDQVSIVENGEIKEEDVIKLFGAYVRIRENNPEINMGKFGKLIVNPDEGKDLIITDLKSPARKKINELQNNDFISIRGIFVEIYPNVKVFERDGGNKGVVANGVIDDGTGNIRAAFYDKMAEKLLDIPTDELVQGNLDEKVIENRKKDLLGKEVLINAKVKYNDFSGNNELTVREIDLDPDPKVEIEILLEESEKLKTEEK